MHYGTLTKVCPTNWPYNETCSKTGQTIKFFCYHHWLVLFVFQPSHHLIIKSGKWKHDALTFCSKPFYSIQLQPWAIFGHRSNSRRRTSHRYQRRQDVSWFLVNSKYFKLKNYIKIRNSKRGFVGFPWFYKQSFLLNSKRYILHFLQWKIKGSKLKFSEKKNTISSLSKETCIKVNANWAFEMGERKMTCTVIS